MNILFIVPYVPSLVRVRPYNLIRFLAAQGHRITLATLWTTPQEKVELEALREICAEVHAVHLSRWRSLANAMRTLPSHRPVQSAYCWHPALAAELDTLLMERNGRAPFDVIHVEHLRGARYGLALQKRIQQMPERQRPRLVWDSVDSISLLFRQAAGQSRSILKRLITRLELPRTERYEPWLATQFDLNLLTSPNDRAAFLSLLGAAEASAAARIQVLPNGVDLDYFGPDPAQTRVASSLVVSGKMSYHANETMVLDLVRDIMPRIWASKPEVKLVIVGKDPPRSIVELADHPKIDVTGTVPDLRPYLQQATVALAPITYGAGIQNKVLEAMACGTPVVTSENAVMALSAVPGRDLLVGSTPAEIADAVLFLLANASEREAIGAAGLHYVKTEHDWQGIVARLERLYEQVAV